MAPRNSRLRAVLRTSRSGPRRTVIQRVGVPMIFSPLKTGWKTSHKRTCRQILIGRQPHVGGLCTPLGINYCSNDVGVRSLSGPKINHWTKMPPLSLPASTIVSTHQWHDCSLGHTKTPGTLEVQGCLWHPRARRVMWMLSHVKHPLDEFTLTLFQLG